MEQTYTDTIEAVMENDDYELTWEEAELLWGHIRLGAMAPPREEDSLQ
jgi:hypothetical protein